MLKTIRLLVCCFSLIGFSSAKAVAEPPVWLLKRVEIINQRRTEIADAPPIDFERIVVIPGWNKLQAMVLAGSFINGRVDSVEGIIAEKAMYEVGEYQGNKSSILIARGVMKGAVPLGPDTYFDLPVTMVFDANGNLLKREFLLPVDRPGQFQPPPIKTK
jgi:hypothetical protein